jgi:putative transposon-encoded protein
LKVQKKFLKKAKQIGNSAYIPFHKKFLGKEVLVILPKGRVIYAKRAIKVK